MLLYIITNKTISILPVAFKKNKMYILNDILLLTVRIFWVYYVQIDLSKRWSEYRHNTLAYSVFSSLTVSKLRTLLKGKL